MNLYSLSITEEKITKGFFPVCFHLYHQHIVHAKTFLLNKGIAYENINLELFKIYFPTLTVKKKDRLQIISEYVH